MTARLAPCPFCGGRAEIARGEHSFTDVKIRCSACSAEGPLFEDDARAVELNEADAVEHWNRRVG